MRHERVRRWCSWIVLAATFTVAGAACGGPGTTTPPTGADAEPRAVPTAPSTPSDAPPATPGHGSAPPESTPGVSEQVTFIRHFYDLINLALRTGNTQPMLAASDPGCLSCQGMSDVITKFHENGGKREGDYLWKVVTINLLGNGTYLVEARIDPHVVHPSSGSSATPVPVDTVVLEYHLKAKGDTWVVEQSEVQP